MNDPFQVMEDENMDRVLLDIKVLGRCQRNGCSTSWTKGKTTWHIQGGHSKHELKVNFTWTRIVWLLSFKSFRCKIFSIISSEFVLFYFIHKILLAKETKRELEFPPNSSFWWGQFSLVILFRLLFLYSIFKEWIKWMHVCIEFSIYSRKTTVFVDSNLIVISCSG